MNNPDRASKYPTREECLSILTKAGCSEKVINHILTVTEIALKIAARFPEVDMNLIEAGGLLHDLGRAKTHGITHAIEGSKLARELSLPEKIVSIIEHHIGAGITKEDAADLDLPIKDYIPKTLEERIIAHADNLVEGNKRVSIQRSVQVLESKGLAEVAERVTQMHLALSKEAGIDIDDL